MRTDPDEINGALAGLARQVVDRLVDVGWQQRHLGDSRLAVLTRPVQGGVIAVVELARTSSGWPDGWPVQVGVSLSVGYEPALALMPVLTLPARAAIVDEFDDHIPFDMDFDLESAGGVDTVAVQIAEFVERSAPRVTVGFADPAAIEAYLRAQSADTQTSGADDGEVVEDGDVRLRMVVLAAMGRHDAARDLLTEYSSRLSAGPLDRADRRFARQLRRWLDAGGPPPPPVEESVARIPRPEPPSKPSWSRTRAESNIRKEAFEAARVRSRGLSREQVGIVFAAECRARGIELSPVAFEVNVDAILMARQPFGRARNAVNGLRMLASFGHGAVSLFRQGDEPAPEWMRAPERAAYPAAVSRDQYSAIVLDETARGFLEHVHDHGPRRIATGVLLDVWIARDPDGTIAAYIGHERVGTIIPTDAARFHDVLELAAGFDEDPFLPGVLSSHGGPGTHILEVRLPLPR